MKNLRIANKLILSLGGIGLLLLILAGTAVSQLGSMTSIMDLSLRDRLPKTLAAEVINTSTSDFRIAEAQHILTSDQGGMKDAEAEMDAQKALINSSYKQLDETLKVPEARVLLGEVKAAWDAYLGEHEKLLAQSRQDHDAEATAIMKGPEEKLFEQLAKATSDLTAFEKKLMEDSATEGDAVSARARTILLVVAAFALAGLGGMLTLLVQQVAKPVVAMTGALVELAKGRMDVVVPVDERADEVGALATAMKQLRDQLAAAERAKAEQTTLIVDSVGNALSKLADGDLVGRVDADLTGPFAKLKTDFNEAAASLQSTLSQVAEAARAIDGGAGEIRMASDDLSQRTEQQAASLEETAAAMNEITSTVRTTAERADSANAAVKTARDEAERSGAIVRDAVEAMGGIERTSNEISDIISVIDGIAFQTNLLALNAGVEAARAGDAGKGFAVVASEVRALAQRSAEAAKDVKTRITASSEQVAAGVQLVGETGKALDRIIASVAEVNTLVSDIAASAEQQATGLQQVNTAVSEMDNVTQQNAAMVEQATAAARSLAGEAENMTRQIARFKTGHGAASAASPVHQLQARAASGARRVAKVAVAGGNAAEDWSEF